MNIVSRAAIVCMTCACTACASIPNITMHYYLAKADMHMKVTRTVDCDAKDNLIVQTTFVPEITQEADETTLQTFELGKFNGALSDSDMKFDFFDDGRLRDINDTSTGEASTIIKSSVALLNAARSADYHQTDASPGAACAYILAEGKGKPLTLTYEGAIDLNSPGDQKIPADSTSAAYEVQLIGMIGTVTASSNRDSLQFPVPDDEVKRDPPPLMPKYDPHAGDLLLVLRQPAVFHVTVKAGPVEGHETAEWDAGVPAGQYGKKYALPLPHAVAFGQEQLVATFNDSGAITAFEYGKKTGTAQALDAVSAALPEFQGETATKKASDLKAEADVIAQQQRLVSCRADPTTCK